MAKEREGGRRARGRAVSFKPETFVRDGIDPIDDLWCPVDRGTPTTPMSIRVPNALMTLVDYYTHDPRFPWRSRSDFCVSAVFRLLEDVQKIEKHSDFDDSLGFMDVMMQKLRTEREGQAAFDVAQAISQTVNKIIQDGDIAEAKRLLCNLRETAERMRKPRWREKILGLIAQYGELGQGPAEGD